MKTPHIKKMVAKILKDLPRYAMTREDKMWGLKKLSVGAYADISDLDKILTEALTELEAETVPSSTFVEETKEAYHSGYLSGVAEKERAVEAERERIKNVTVGKEIVVTDGDGNKETVIRVSNLLQALTPKQTN